tara:strand:- start:243 stop:635 length:393 start_codon:yes stop_codon:yes gene_type:complete
MANTLKLITVSASDIDGSGGDLAADTDRNLYTVSGTVSAAIIVGFHVCNILSNTIKITVTISSDTGSNASGFGGATNKDAFLVKNVPIPEGSTIELLSGNKIFLEDTDIIKIQSDTAASFNCVLSFVEQT